MKTLRGLALDRQDFVASIIGQAFHLFDAPSRTIVLMAHTSAAPPLDGRVFAFYFVNVCTLPEAVMCRLHSPNRNRIDLNGRDALAHQEEEGWHGMAVVEAEAAGLAETTPPLIFVLVPEDYYLLLPALLQVSR